MSEEKPEEKSEESQGATEKAEESDPWKLVGKNFENISARLKSQDEALVSLGKVIHETVLPALSVLAQKDSKVSSNPGGSGAEDLVSMIAKGALKVLDFVNSSGGQSVLKMVGNAFKEPDPRVQEYEDFKSKMMNHNLKMFDLKLESVEMDNAAKRKRLEGERPFWE